MHLIYWLADRIGSMEPFPGFLCLFIPGAAILWGLGWLIARLEYRRGRRG